jgi:AbiJ N-terminal domain 4
LNEAVSRNYLSDWHVVAKELRRIAREPLRNYNPRSVPSMEEARNDSELYLNQIGWEQVYDFCERLQSHIAQDIVYDEVVTTTKAQAQLFIAEEMQRLFEEENLGYEFRDGFVQRRGKRHTIDQINKAETARIGALSTMTMSYDRVHSSSRLFMRSDSRSSAGSGGVGPECRICRFGMAGTL